MNENVHRDAFAFSPPLDEAGNSVRAQHAIQDVSKALGGNPFDAKLIEA